MLIPMTCRNEELLTLKKQLSSKIERLVSRKRYQMFLSVDVAPNFIQLFFNTFEKEIDQLFCHAFTSL